MSIRDSVLLSLALLAGSAGVAHARGKLFSVVPLVPNGACVQVPDGDTDQFWDVEAGKTYVCTIIDVDDCANGGTDPTIGIRVNATGPGFIDLVANKQAATGVYEFTIRIPENNPSCTLPIFYCTPPGSSDPGLRVLRSCPAPCNDDDEHPAHLRIAEFGPLPACANPTFPACETTATRARTWAQVKQIYR